MRPRSAARSMRRDQIGKIAVAPIAGRSDPVKLHRKRPHPRGRVFTTLIGTIAGKRPGMRRRSMDRRSRDRDMQAKYAMRQGLAAGGARGKRPRRRLVSAPTRFPTEAEGLPGPLRWSDAIGLPAHDHGPWQQPGRLLSPPLPENPRSLARTSGSTDRRCPNASRYSVSRPHRAARSKISFMIGALYAAIGRAAGQAQTGNIFPTIGRPTTWPIRTWFR